MLLGFIIVLAIIGDQASKFWAIERLKGQESIVLIKNFLELHYLENKGVAFGMLSKWSHIFPFLSFAIVIVLLIIYKKEKDRQNTGFKVAMALIIGGALGNVIDRLMRDYVVDFISFHFGSYDFPIFNVADSCVTIGVIILIIVLLKTDEKDLVKE